MKSITKRIIATLGICAALVLEAGATAFKFGSKNVSETKAVESSVTFDLTSSGTSKRTKISEASVNYADGDVTFSLIKGTGSAANNYCPGGKTDNSGHTRVYNGNSAEFGVGTGYVITKIEVTATTGSYFGGLSTASNYSPTATVSTSSATATISFASTVRSKTVTASTTATGRLTGIKIYYDVSASYKYTAKFDSNGGSGTMEDVGQDSASYTLPECAFTAPSSGKIFDSWALGSTSGTKYAVGATATLTEGTNTFYAIWKDISYTDLPDGDYSVSFNATSDGKIPNGNYAIKADTSTVFYRPLVVSSTSCAINYTPKEFVYAKSSGVLNITTQSNAVIESIVADVYNNASGATYSNGDKTITPTTGGTAPTSHGTTYTFDVGTKQFTATVGSSYTLAMYSFTVKLHVGAVLEPLATPSNFSLSDKTLNWDAVTNAGSYKIKVGSNEYTSTTNSYTFESALDECAYVSVIAVPSDTSKYKDSDPGYYDNTNYGTTAAPLTGDQALNVMQKQLNGTAGYTRQRLYVRAKATNTKTASSNKFSQVNINTSSGDLLVYTLHTSGTMTTITAGQYISFNGFGYYYSTGSKYEFTDNGSEECTLTDIVTPVTSSIRFKAGSDLTTKTYYTSDDWDYSGLEVEKVYNTGDVEVITSQATFTADKTTQQVYDASETSVNITAHYVESSTTFDSDPINITGLTINLDAITGISIISEPTKKEYYLGETFDKTGLVVHATYTHKAEQDITESSSLEITPPDMFTENDSASVKVKYGEFEKTISGFKVKKVTAEIPESWDLVISNSDVVDGLEFVMASKDYGATAGDISSQVMASIASGNVFNDAKNKITTLNSDTVVLKLATSGEHFAIKNGNSLLGATAVKKLAWDSGTTTWDIEVDSDGVATIDNTTSSYGQFYYNSNSGSERFTTYTSAQKDVQIYKHVEGLSIKPIRINSASNSKTYYAGNAISADDFTINVFKNDGTNADVVNTSESKVITIDKSTLAAGENEITITYAGLTYKTTITAGEYIPVTSVTLSDESVSLVAGQTHQFTATVLPTNATNPNVTYSVEGDSTVATISSSGLLTSYKAGSIVVKASADGKSDSCTVTVSEKAISSISVVSNPTKLSYVAGQSFDPIGLVIKVTYNDSSESNVSYADHASEFSFSPSGALATTDNKVTVTYGGKSTDVNITVIAKTLESISVKTQPTKLSYIVGQSFDPTGLVINATYNDGTVEVSYADHASDFSFSPDGALKTTDNKVTITYGGKSTDINISVAAKALESISVKTQPTKVSYIEGQSFDPTGLVINAVYNTGTEAISYAEHASDFSFSPSGALATTDNKVTVTYGGKSTDINISVVAKSLANISISSQPSKIDYIEGNTFDPTGLEIQASYNNGDVETIKYSEHASDFSFNPTTLAYGDTKVTVSYGGKTADISVTVAKKSVTSITTDVSSVQLAYNTDISSDDIKVTIHYDNGDSELANFSDLVITGYDKTQVGVYNNVEVNYKGTKTTITVEVLASTIVDHIIATTEKTEIEYGGTLSIEDIEVTAVYTDGREESVACESISGFSSTTVGEQKVTVEAVGKTTTVTVEVLQSTVVESIYASTEKTTVDYGSSFTKNDVTVTYVYTDGHVEEGKPAESISGYDPNKIGTQTIEVTAAGKTTTITITVNGHVVTSIDAVEYNKYVDQGGTYKYDGKVVVNYADGSSEVITEGFTVGIVDTTNHGQQKVKISYGKVSTEIIINVVQTKTPLDSVQIVSVAGGSVVGITALAICIYFLLKSFKLH